MARNTKPQRGFRTEYGHNFQWHERLKFWYHTPFHLNHNPVQIFPPSAGRLDWWVVVPGTGKFFNPQGRKVEERCFAIAAGFITQK